MGNWNCFKANDTSDQARPVSGTSNSTGKELPVASRVTDQDRAILDVKARLRKLRTYIDKLNL